MVTAVSEVSEKTMQILEPWRGRKGFLIPVLQAVQHAFGYVPKEAIEVISREMKMPTAEIYGVVTFYAQFHLKPRGRHVIRVCRGTACHVKGSAAVLEALKRNLKIEPGQTTKDGLFSLEIVACIGACGLAPVIAVNGEFHAQVTPDKITRILNTYRRRAEA